MLFISDETVPSCQISPSGRKTDYFQLAIPFISLLATSENWAVTPLQGNPTHVLSVPGRSWIAEMPPAHGWTASSAIQGLQKVRPEHKKRVFTLLFFSFQHSKLYVLSRQKFCLIFNLRRLSFSTSSLLFVNFQIYTKKMIIAAELFASPDSTCLQVKK